MGKRKIYRYSITGIQYSLLRLHDNLWFQLSIRQVEPLIRFVPRLRPFAWSRAESGLETLIRSSSCSLDGPTSLGHSVADPPQSAERGPRGGAMAPKLMTVWRKAVRV